MEILYAYEDLKGWAQQHGKAMAASIGFFDGLHRGHQYLLSELYHVATANGLKSLAITFRNAPRGYHQPDHDWLHLTTTAEKLHLLQQTSIDAVLVLEYRGSNRGAVPATARPVLPAGGIVRRL